MDWHGKKSFYGIKHAVVYDTSLAYLDFNKRFVIHKYASDYQLGALIIQDIKPIAFYVRKLNSLQTRYTVTENEYLSMVKTLKEFRTILLGQQFKTFTDHKNLTCKNFNTNHLLWWRPILEEHSPEIEYIPVKKNIVEVALS